MITVQLAVLAIVTAGAWIYGGNAGVSAFAGGFICAVANTHAAWRVFRKPPKVVSEYGELSNLYRAEFGKLIIIGTLTAFVFAVSQVKILAFVAGCISVLLAGTLVGATFTPQIDKLKETVSKK